MQKVLFSLIVGFLLGLVVAAIVSFSINNAKIPFVDRFSDREDVQVPPDWNPNASLQPGSVTVTEPPPALRGNTTTNTGNVTPDTNPPAIAVSGGNTATTTPTDSGTTSTPPPSSVQFYVQAGAFASRQEAEQVRARLALAGAQATISQVNAAGQVVHRVRVGPYNTRAEAQATLQKLSSNGIESAIVGS